MQIAILKRAFLVIFMLYNTISFSVPKTINYYKVLGIKQTASTQEIKKAYKKITKQKPSSKKLLKLNSAYDHLVNPINRFNYDFILTAVQTEKKIRRDYETTLQADTNRFITNLKQSKLDAQKLFFKKNLLSNFLKKVTNNNTYQESVKIDLSVNFLRSKIAELNAKKKKKALKKLAKEIILITNNDQKSLHNGQISQQDYNNMYLKLQVLTILINDFIYVDYELTHDMFETIEFYFLELNDVYQDKENKLPIKLRMDFLDHIHKYMDFIFDHESRTYKLGDYLACQNILE